MKGFIKELFTTVFNTETQPTPSISSGQKGPSNAGPQVNVAGYGL